MFSQIQNSSLAFSQRYFCVAIIFSVLFSVVFSLSNPSLAKTRVELQQDIEEMNEEMAAKEAEVEELTTKMQEIQKNITLLQKDTKNLKNELALLSLHIDEKKAEIDVLNANIEVSNQKIQHVTLEILEKEMYVQQKKQGLIKALRNLERLKRRDPLEILILNTTFSEFYHEVKQADDVQQLIQSTVKNIQLSKAFLLEKKDELENINQKLMALFRDLELEKKQLEQQQGYKTALVIQTKNSETRYQRLLQEAKKEQEAISVELTKLDALVREKVKELEQLGRSGVDFIWPITASKGISTYFYDPTYPYRYLFEHPGIDVPAAYGTTIVAPLDGYVAKVRSPEQAGKGYSYLMLIHDNGLATVYGHLSCVKIGEDTFVKQNDAIACVGGTPGTKGAGALTTGAHLHFEVRENGIPVDPLRYLP